MQSHSYVNQLSVRDLVAPSPFSYVNTAAAEVFNKTLALFCAIAKHGCSLKSDLPVPGAPAGSDEDLDGDDEEDHDETMPVCETDSKCPGWLTMRRDQLNRAYLL